MARENPRLLLKVRQFVSRIRMNRLHKSNLDALRRFDPEGNEKSAPPEDEEVRLVALWAVEFYSPTHTDNLYRSFRRLGWNKNKEDARHDPLLWLDDLRAKQGAGWMSLGMLTPNDNSSFVGMTRHTVPLPDHVAYAMGSIHALTPSLNCIAVCFVFDDESDHSPIKAYDHTLRSYYQTRRVPTEHGWRILRPKDQKARQIRDIRKRLSEDALRWFKEHLPGIFSSGVLVGHFPTCEFIVTKQAEPFDSPFNAFDSWGHYTSILGLDHYAVWKNKTIPVGIRFPFGAFESDYHLIVAGKEAPLIERLNQDAQAADIRSIVFQLNDVVPFWFVTWALLPLLESFTRRIIEVRNASLLRQRHRRTKWFTRVFGILEAYIASSVDISAVAKDLEDRDTVEQLLWPGGDLQSSNEESDREIPLKTLISEDVAHRARWIQETDRVLREQLTQYGALIGAAENVRLQSRIRTLTWVLLVIAVLAIALTQQWI